jgi:hypothetical protein
VDSNTEYCDKHQVNYENDEKCGKAKLIKSDGTIVKEKWLHDVKI